MNNPIREKRDLCQTTPRLRGHFAVPLARVQDSFWRSSQENNPLTMTLTPQNGSQKSVFSFGPSPTLSQTRDSQNDNHLTMTLISESASRKNSLKGFSTSGLNHSKTPVLQNTPSPVGLTRSMAKVCDNQSYLGSAFHRFFGGKLLPSNNDVPVAPKNPVSTSEFSFSSFGRSTTENSRFKDQIDYNPKKAVEEFVQTESNPMLTELNKNVLLLMDIVKNLGESDKEPMEKKISKIFKILSLILEENKSSKIETNEIFNKLNDKIVKIMDLFNENYKRQDFIRFETNMEKFFTKIERLIQKQSEREDQMEILMDSIVNKLDGNTNKLSEIETVIKSQRLFKSEQSNNLNPPKARLMMKRCPPKDLTGKIPAPKNKVRVQEREAQKKKIYLVYPSDTDDYIHPSQLSNY